MEYSVQQTKPLIPVYNLNLNLRINSCKFSKINFNIF